MMDHSLSSESRGAARRARLALIGALALAMLLWADAAALAAKVTFRYQPVIGGPGSVAVAGSFNGWNATANPMKDDDKDGVWETTVEIPAGRVEYKFVVNGDQWMTDDNAPDTSADGFGGQNGVFVVQDQPLVVGHGSKLKKAAPAIGLRQVTFRFKPPGTPQSVHLAGTFNDWNVGRSPMTDPDHDGVYTTMLLLPVGSYQYKFVVNGSQWIPDTEHQDGAADDGYGGKNSVLNVDERFPAVNVKRGDGDIFADGIAHEQGANEVDHLGGGHVEFTAKSHHDDVEAVELVTWAQGTQRVTPLHLVSHDQIYDYWRGEAALPDSGATPYAFRYRDGKTTEYLTRSGLSSGADSGRFTFDAARFPAFRTPDWVKNGIIYQIFPDRFRNGNPANDPDFKEWYYQGKNAPPASGKLDTDYEEYYHLVKDWNDAGALTHNPYTKDGRDWMAFYGGDIDGVRKSLDYLQDLGVTAIYFNPLFEAKSTHKYDAADYRKIDPHFGSNDEFLAFVKEAKARGIHVILDIVYNHSGNAHWAFKDIAEKGRQSPYWSWYEFKQWPLPAGWPNVGHAWKPADYYYCWWGFGDLPDLNFDLSRANDAENAIRDVKDAQPNIALVTYLLDATSYWLENGVDGVRLDVPNEVPFWFWKLFHERVKKVNPDAYIVGELWGNATDWVRPDVFDAVMNYAFFRDPVQRFLGMGQGSAQEFDATLATGRLAYPSQAVEAQMNLIDSHDTPRFLTQVGGDVKRLLLAATFAMTYVGAPHIYYGDEIGMEGGKDPDCRRPFVWDWKNDSTRVRIHDTYRRLAALRRAHPALRTGEFRTVFADGKLFGYARSGNGESFVVALNASPSSETLPLDLASWGGSVKAKDMLAGTTATWTGTGKIEIPGETGRIFQILPAGSGKPKPAPGTGAKPRSTAGSAPSAPSGGKSTASR